MDGPVSRQGVATYQVEFDDPLPDQDPLWRKSEIAEDTGVVDGEIAFIDTARRSTAGSIRAVIRTSVNGVKLSDTKGPLIDESDDPLAHARRDAAFFKRFRVFGIISLGASEPSHEELQTVQGAGTRSIFTAIEPVGPGDTLIATTPPVHRQSPRTPGMGTDKRILGVKKMDDVFMARDAALHIQDALKDLNVTNPYSNLATFIVDVWLAGYATGRAGGIAGIGTVLDTPDKLEQTRDTARPLVEQLVTDMDSSGDLRMSKEEAMRDIYNHVVTMNSRVIGMATRAGGPGDVIDILMRLGQR